MKHTKFLSLLLVGASYFIGQIQHGCAQSAQGPYVVSSGGGSATNVSISGVVIAASGTALMTTFSTAGSNYILSITKANSGITNNSAQVILFTNSFSVSNANFTAGTVDSNGNFSASGQITAGNITDVTGDQMSSGLIQDIAGDLLNAGAVQDAFGDRMINGTITARTQFSGPGNGLSANSVPYASIQTNGATSGQILVNSNATWTAMTPAISAGSSTNGLLGTNSSIAWFGIGNITNLFSPGGIIAGSITATNSAQITGNGSGLTNLNLASLGTTNTLAGLTLPVSISGTASNLSGVISGAQVSGINTNLNFTATNQYGNLVTFGVGNNYTNYGAGGYTNPVGFVAAGTNGIGTQGNFAFDIIPATNADTWVDICNVNGRTNQFSTGNWLHLMMHGPTQNNGVGCVSAIGANNGVGTEQGLVLEDPNFGTGSVGIGTYNFSYLGSASKLTVEQDGNNFLSQINVANTNSGTQAASSIKLFAGTNWTSGGLYIGTFCNALTPVGNAFQAGGNLIEADTGASNLNFCTRMPVAPMSFYVGSYTANPVFVLTNNLVLANTNLSVSSGNAYYGNGVGLTNLPGTSGLVNSNFYACPFQTNICTYTVPTGVTNTYQVGGYINVTANTSDVIIGKVLFTDENNASQTVSLMTTGISTTGFNPIASQQIRCKGGTLITLQATLTTGIGSITYDCGGNIEVKQ